MARTVWCVFQRLEGESCPTLAAVCGSRAAADRMVALGQRDDAGAGGGAGEWTIGAWSVVDDELAEIEEIGQLSDALDPWRAGTVPPEEEGVEDAEAAAPAGEDAGAGGRP